MKLTLKPNNQQEADLRNENNELKIDILENKDKALKIKPMQKDSTKDKDSVVELGYKDSSTMETKISCEKCGMYFSSKEEVKQHKSDMHKVKLIFKSCYHNGLTTEITFTG